MLHSLDSQVLNSLAKAHQEMSSFVIYRKLDLLGIGFLKNIFFLTFCISRMSISHPILNKVAFFLVDLFFSVFVLAICV